MLHLPSHVQLGFLDHPLHSYPSNHRTVYRDPSDGEIREQARLAWHPSCLYAGELLYSEYLERQVSSRLTSVEKYVHRCLLTCLGP